MNRTMRVFAVCVLLIALVFSAVPSFAVFKFASEKKAVEGSLVSLTAATYLNCTKALITFLDAPILWSCDVTGFTADNTTGTPQLPYSQIWLDSAVKIRNFRAVRATATSGNLVAQYFEQ